MTEKIVEFVFDNLDEQGQGDITVIRVKINLDDLALLKTIEALSARGGVVYDWVKRHGIYSKSVYHSREKIRDKENFLTFVTMCGCNTWFLYRNKNLYYLKDAIKNDFSKWQHYR